MKETSSSPSDILTISDAEQRRVFWEWCLHREAFSRQITWPWLLPILYWGVTTWGTQGTFRASLTPGTDLLGYLFLLAIATIVFKGSQHAGHAVAWEVSHDLRDLVRLTGLSPLALLICKSASRWIAILCSVLLFVPFVFLAMTMGGVTWDNIIACGEALVMLAALVAGFASIVSVTSTDSENARSASQLGVLLLLLMYHLLFWFAAAVTYLAHCWINGSLESIPLDSSWRIPFDCAWKTAPAAVLTHAFFSSDQFSLLAPSYWIHFVIAAGCFRMASIVIRNRFRTSVGGDDPLAQSQVGSPRSRVYRPRCTDSPLFWKDAYILAGGDRSVRRWNRLYFAMAAMIAVVDVARMDTTVPLVLGIIAECLAPVIVAVRLDALMAVEFREQTWAGLMLLPIPPRLFVWAKLQAVMWEQRALLLPVTIAVAFALSFSPMAVLMAGVLALLVGLQICLFSILNHILRRTPWERKALAGLFIFLLLASSFIWQVGSPWLGFATTSTFLLIASVIHHAFVFHELDRWTEEERME